MDRLVTMLGMGVLAFNSLLAIYNSWGDTGAVAFVLVADASLLLLFFFLRQYERGGARGRAQGRGRDSTKVAVWSLTTLLTGMFAAKVAPVMPPAVAALVWAMAVATAAAGFWAFFLNNP